MTSYPPFLLATEEIIKYWDGQPTQEATDAEGEISIPYNEQYKDVFLSNLNHSHAYVRRGIAINYTVPPEILDMLKDDESEAVVGPLILNPNVTVDTVIYLFDRINWYLNHIHSRAWRSKLNDYRRTYSSLTQDLSYFASQEKSTPEILHKLTTDSDWGNIYLYLAAHPNTNWEDLEHIHKNCLAVFDGKNFPSKTLEAAMYYELWRNKNFTNHRLDLLNAEPDYYTLDSDHLIELLVPEKYMKYARIGHDY